MYKILYRMKRIIFKLYPQLMTSNDFVEWLSYHGIEVGEGTHFFGPASTEVDIQRPWMLYIGKYCKITSGVKILCHDYSRSVLRRVYGEIIGEAEETYIGDNVFIGMNSIILMGSHIGNNVIIGAGSVVKGNIPDNTVIAGNPAKVIYTLDDYYKKRKSRTLDESFEYFFKFYSQYNRYPSASEMGPFFSLFLERSKDALAENDIFTNFSGDNERDVISDYILTTGVYANYNEYIKAANSKRKF